MFAKKLLVGALAAAAFISAQAADQKVLRMATESSYPPFEFVETKTGETVGFEIDLLRGIAERIGRKLEIVPMGFDAIIPALLTNTADVGMAAITITPERQKRLAFTDSYYVSGLSVLIRAADKATITKVEDLNNRTICAQIGTSGHMRAQQVPGAKVKAFNNVSETFLELSNKGCDAVIGDRPVNSYFLMSRPQTAKDFYHMPVMLNTELFGIAAKKSNKALVEEMNAAMKAMRADGSYGRMYKKWVGEEPPKE